MYNLEVSSLLQLLISIQKRITETPLPELKFKTFTGNLSTAILCGKWFFDCLTWPVPRPGFRR